MTKLAGKLQQMFQRKEERDQSITGPGADADDQEQGETNADILTHA